MRFQNTNEKIKIDIKKSPTVYISNNKSFVNNEAKDNFAIANLENKSKDDSIPIDEFAQKTSGTFLVDNPSQVYNGYDLSFLNYKVGDIEKDLGITEYNGNNYRVINFNDGYQAWFDEETKKLTFLMTHDGSVSISFDYDISDSEREELNKGYKLNPDAPIDFIARSNIRGHEFKFYSIDSDNGQEASLVKNFSTLYNESYSDEILALIENNFTGILISPWYWSDSPELQGTAGAYVSIANNRDPYMFIPCDKDFNSAYYKYTTPYHETGHVIQANLERQHRFDTKTLEELYDKYKETMATMPESSYSNGRGNTESPDEDEFFADASVNYFMCPEELQRYMPEVYDFVKEIYG